VKRLHLLAFAVCAIVVVLALVTLHYIDHARPDSQDKDAMRTSGALEGRNSSEDVQKRMRLAHLQDLRHDVDEEELLRLMDASDRATAWVDEHDIDSIQEHVHDRMREFDIPKKDIEEYYNANRDLFGNRGLEESAYTIENILKIQNMKQEFQEL
jgi:hypothetical protein